MSLNIKIMPHLSFQPGVGSYNGISLEDRLAAAAYASSCYGVAGFQEVWRTPSLKTDDSRGLVDALKKQGFDYFYRSKENNGLLIASRYEILKRETLTFKDEAGWDALAEKGVQYVQVEVNGRKVDIFNTHLQAHAKKADKKARAKQLKDLHAFINSTESGNRIVVGDFNITKDWNKEEYSDWMSNSKVGDWSSFDFSSTGSKGWDYILTEKSCLKTTIPETGYVTSNGELHHQIEVYRKYPFMAEDVSISDHPMIGVGVSFACPT